MTRPPVTTKACQTSDPQMKTAIASPKAMQTNLLTSPLAFLTKQPANIDVPKRTAYIRSCHSMSKDVFLTHRLKIGKSSVHWLVLNTTSIRRQNYNATSTSKFSGLNKRHANELDKIK